jgi:hypothetical protein
MRTLGVVGLVLAVASGCVTTQPWADEIAPPVAIRYENPMTVLARDPFQLWETVADVADDYFRIQEELPVRVVENTVTEGRLDTYWEVGSTVFEPWRHDSADPYEKLESTLQSIRRRAQIRVIPGTTGYQIDVAVFKELEDVSRPAHASAGSATFRHDSSLTRVVNPLGEQEINQGWVPLGRDRALEQRILAQLAYRLGMAPPPSALQPIPPGCPPRL